MIEVETMAAHAIRLSKRRQRTARSPEVAAETVGPADPTEPKPGLPDDFGTALTRRFANAVSEAVRAAHSEGFAVPARRNGVAIEVRPNGEAAAIREGEDWSPTAWRKGFRTS